MIELGLQRISRLLAQTPLPWRAIHVAGTNGKGSICNYVSGMLEAYNVSPYRKRRQLPTLSHGRFTSPHLIDRWDCITINQQTVSSELFHAVEKRVLARDAAECIQASEFELLTATAFEIFTQEKVDIGVVEVGMGGRLDATNILGQPVAAEYLKDDQSPPVRATPLITAISDIGFDHEAFLGNTIEAIAREKAGIMKCDVPVIFHACSNRGALALEEVFNRTGADLSAADLESLDSHYDHRAKCTDDSTGTEDPQCTKPFLHNGSPWTPRYLAAHYDHDMLATALDPFTDTFGPGNQPIPNILIAFRSTWLALQQLQLFPAPSSSTLPALQLDALLTLAKAFALVPSRTIYPGRQQLLSLESLTYRSASVLLDGAHNVESMSILCGKIRQLYGYDPEVRYEGRERITFVLAFSSSKPVGRMLEQIIRPGDDIFAVEFGPVDGMPWVKAMGCEEILSGCKQVLAKMAGSERMAADYGHYEAGVGVKRAHGKDVLGALRAASEQANEGPMVVAGSLYLVGDVLRLLREAQ
jgi:folylpolyglutamate synthase/dihydropteroate synthase